MGHAEAGPSASELITQNHARAAGRDLVVNVDAVRDQMPPVRNAILVDDEIDRIRSVPRFEDKIFIQIFVPGGGVLFEEIRELIHEEKLLFEIETEAVSAR